MLSAFGNYKSFNLSSIDNLEDFTEKILRINFEPNFEPLVDGISSYSQKWYSAGFIIKYNITKPESGNLLLYIIIGVSSAILIGAIVFFFLRRGNKRDASERL